MSYIVNRMIVHSVARNSQRFSSKITRKSNFASLSVASLSEMLASKKLQLQEAKEMTFYNEINSSIAKSLPKISSVSHLTSSSANPHPVMLIAKDARRIVREEILQTGLIYRAVDRVKLMLSQEYPKYDSALKHFGSTNNDKSSPTELPPSTIFSKEVTAVEAPLQLETSFRIRFALE